MESPLRKGLAMKAWHKAALAAYLKGYRVTDSGELLSPSGLTMSLKAKKSDRGYPRFGVWLEDEKRSVRIPAHKFAALAFFGLKAFSSPCIRHKNDDRTDFSRGNILLGSYEDNAQDKCPKQRTRCASIAGQSSPNAVAYRELQESAREGFKICSCCRVELEIENFYRRSSSKDGYEYVCKGCCRERKVVSNG